MATIRKASAYSKRSVTPYTRKSKRKNRSYIKVVPPQKIVKFTMGNTPAMRNGKFPHKLTVICTEYVQIRHNALEACRQYLNRKLDKTFPGQFVFKVIPYPHHIQRENKMLTGAGADRMQTGMQLSYGKSVGKAAIMKPGKAIFEFRLANEKQLSFVRNIVKDVRSKLPCKIKTDYENTSKKA